TGRLDDALVIYTSDNGLLWGEHRWIKKEVPYEEAIRIPLVVRADGVVGEGASTDGHLVANIDVAPTIAEAAGAELPNADGKSLLPLLAGEPGEWRRAVLIEHLRGTNPVPTYCAVRSARYLFASYETGERELYDLDADPFQLRNLAGTAPDLEGRLETTLRGLCDPPPPGFGRQMSMAATLLGIAAVLAVAAGARVLLARSGGRRG
ncbi:MAG TPA: sulfatase/phosphatase domain-containing protein, partial [Actinomycetota bacterium]|nr:sulfatase/phosphatase domain-containing protein [Actinomycetota bacterium]